LPGESLETQARATSQAFYVIRGSGVSTSTEHGEIKWNTGDLFVLPAAITPVSHAALGVEAAEGGEAAALYWVSDEPLLRYLGVNPSEKKFEPTLYTRKRMVESVELLKHEEGVEHRNRLGILLGNRATEKNTLTLTHTLWSLLNLLPAGQKQRPHRYVPSTVPLFVCVL
jgi:gentisate 1,2-dioxygenase